MAAMQPYSGPCHDPYCATRNGGRQHSCSIHMQMDLPDPNDEQPLPLPPASPRPSQRASFVPYEYLAPVAYDPDEVETEEVIYRGTQGSGSLAGSQSQGESDGEVGGRKGKGKRKDKMPRISRASQAKEQPDFHPAFPFEKYPGRFPAGDASIDLASINLALGSDINGTQPMSIDASHGGFPNFIFGPNRPSGSDEALMGGPFEAWRAGQQRWENEQREKAHLKKRQRAAAAANVRRSDYASTSIKQPASAGFAPSERGFAPQPEASSSSSGLYSTASAAPQNLRAASSSASPAYSALPRAPLAPGASSQIPASFAATVPAVEPYYARNSKDTPYFPYASASASFTPFGYEAPKQTTPAQHQHPRRASAEQIDHLSASLGAARLGGEAMQRQSLSPNMAQQQGNGNGNGPNGAGVSLNGMAGSMPVNAGQQMDLNMVFQKVMELSEVLKENRERTQGIVASAEELATRAAASGANPDLQHTDAEISAGRIADLTRANHELQKVKTILLREQRENTKLIGEYETALGNVVEMVRNFGYNKDMAKHAAAREFNARLQEEKDAHLATRLDRDEWHAKAMRCVEMIRHAYKLRCEEEELPTRVVAGLQNEVRAYRNALGMEPEKFEDEFGYEILKHVKNGAGEP